MQGEREVVLSRTKINVSKTSPFVALQDYGGCQQQVEGLAAGDHFRPNKLPIASNEMKIRNAIKIEGSQESQRPKQDKKMKLNCCIGKELTPIPRN